MLKRPYSKLMLAVPMLLLGTGTVYATAPTLVATPPSVTITYTLPGTAGAPVQDIFLPTNAGTFIYVSSGTTPPSWLTVTQSATGGPSSGATFSFQANAVAATLVPGTYSGTVTFATTALGYSPSSVAVTVVLSVKAPAAAFSVSATNNGSLSWFPGQSYPNMTITCASSGEEIGFSVGLGGSIASSMTASVSSGIAFGWGTPVVITFSPQLFLSNPPGTSLTGMVTLTPNNGAPPPSSTSTLTSPPPV